MVRFAVVRRALAASTSSRLIGVVRGQAADLDLAQSRLNARV
jgi:hypothetical protein